MTTTSKRMINGHHKLTRNGVVIGQAWRWPKRHDGSRPVGFGLLINGFYWYKGEANKLRGNSTSSTQTLREAIAIADSVMAAHS